MKEIYRKKHLCSKKCQKYKKNHEISCENFNKNILSTNKNELTEFLYI